MIGWDNMKKSDAYQFVCQAFQDYLNTLPQAAKIALAEKLQACLDALKPIQEQEKAMTDG